MGSVTAPPTLSRKHAMNIHANMSRVYPNSISASGGNPLLNAIRAARPAHARAARVAQGVKRVIRRLPVGAAALTVQLLPAVITFGGRRGFAAEPARRHLAKLAGGAAVLAAVNGLSTAADEREVSRQRWAMPLITGGIILGRVIAPISDRHDWMVLPNGSRRLGLGLYALGITFFEWPRFVMGRQFSFKAAIQEDHELVIRGPYRFMRHPGYAGILGFQTGYALIFRSIPGSLAVVPVAAAVLWRIRDEEALLASEFPEEYDSYSERTARLIPFVY